MPPMAYNIYAQPNTNGMDSGTDEHSAKLCANSALLLMWRAAPIIVQMDAARWTGARTTAVSTNAHTHTHNTHQWNTLRPRRKNWLAEQQQLSNISSSQSNNGIGINDFVNLYTNYGDWISYSECV